MEGSAYEYVYLRMLGAKNRVWAGCGNIWNFDRDANDLKRHCVKKKKEYKEIAGMLEKV